MKEKNQHELKKGQDQDQGFTGMPNDKPYPDFEPKKSEEKQVEQFEDTAENGKENHTDKK
ncbi:MAG: hypothetical protein ABS920_04650 [Sporosarcina sp.]